MYLYQVLHDGSPEFMLAVLALFVALVMSQTVRGSGIARHPYTKPEDGGELASDLPFESIGRPEIEPLLFHSRPTHQPVLKSSVAEVTRRRRPDVLRTRTHSHPRTHHRRGGQKARAAAGATPDGRPDRVEL